jgi:hypothetical protein
VVLCQGAESGGVFLQDAPPEWRRGPRNIILLPNHPYPRDAACGTTSYRTHVSVVADGWRRR